MKGVAGRASGINAGDHIAIANLICSPNIVVVMEAEKGSSCHFRAPLFLHPCLEFHVHGDFGFLARNEVNLLAGGGFELDFGRLLHNFVGVKLNSLLHGLLLGGN